MGHITGSTASKSNYYDVKNKDTYFVSILRYFVGKNLFFITNAPGVSVTYDTAARDNCLRKKNLLQKVNFSNSLFTWVTFCENCRCFVRSFCSVYVWNLTFCSFFLGGKQTNEKRQCTYPNVKNVTFVENVYCSIAGFCSCMKPHIMYLA